MTKSSVREDLWEEKYWETIGISVCRVVRPQSGSRGEKLSVVVI